MGLLGGSLGVGCVELGMVMGDIVDLYRRAISKNLRVMNDERGRATGEGLGREKKMDDGAWFRAGGKRKSHKALVGGAQT